MFDKTNYDSLYIKANYKTLTIRLSRVKDEDLINYLDSLGRSKNAYVKNLLRNQIKKD